MLGLRLEDVEMPETGHPTLPGVVDTVMPAGSDQFLGLKVDGLDVFVRVGKKVKINQGETLTLGPKPERLHLFDQATGRSLREGSAA
jgi:multiple sugar transport system ATP-binding protein